MKVADYVAEFIASKGVRHVFLLPGGGAMHLNDAVGHHPALEVVCNLHEQAAAVAAEAYARVSEGLGVALVTTGPGGTNALTGVLGAWLDSTPCLFLSGQVKRPDISEGTPLRQLGVQEAHIVSMVSPITKYARTVMDPAWVPYILDEAYYHAFHGRPGPVWVDIPLDVQAAQLPETERPQFLPPPADDCETNLVSLADQAWQSLETATRPVILAGNGVRLAGAAADFIAFARQLGIPVLTTRLGVDLIPTDHPLCMGMPGMLASRAANFTLQNSDWLLVLGARLDLALIAYAPEKLARCAKRIMVNVDPHEIARLGDAIQIPVVTDAGRFMEVFLARRKQVPDLTDWWRQCEYWRQKYPFMKPTQPSVESISTYEFSRQLSSLLGSSDIILPGSSGVACEIFLTAFRTVEGQRVFHNKGTGAMGLGQPAAIGACLASGRRRTICVDGDGGFAMNLQELEVVRRLGLPIKFFVLNNDGYASIRASQKGAFHRLSAADATSGLTLPDICRISEAFGIESRVLENPETLRSDLMQVLSHDRPIVCDVRVVKEEPREPRVASRQRPDGSWESTPLEDMWPQLDRQEFLANMLIPTLDQ